MPGTLGDFKTMKPEDEPEPAVFAIFGTLVWCGVGHRAPGQFTGRAKAGLAQM